MDKEKIQDLFRAKSMAELRQEFQNALLTWNHEAIWEFTYAAEDPALAIRFVDNAITLHLAAFFALVHLQRPTVGITVGPRRPERSRRLANLANACIWFLAELSGWQEGKSVSRGVILADLDPQLVDYLPRFFDVFGVSHEGTFQGLCALVKYLQEDENFNSECKRAHVDKLILKTRDEHFGDRGTVVVFSAMTQALKSMGFDE
jgi:hypothetical protein